MSDFTPVHVPLDGDDFIVYGPTVKLNERAGFEKSKGKIRSFMVFDGDLDTPLDIGMEFNKAALKNLPGSLENRQDRGDYLAGEFEIELAYPENSTVFNLLTWTWVAGPNGTQTDGHGPDGVYDVDHFDFHFYLNSQEVRDTINVFYSPDEYAKAQIAPPVDFWPEDYKRPVDAFMNGIGVAPGDGSHWNNVTYPEFEQVDNDEIYQFFESSGVPFGPDQRTVQYGAYDGHMTLLEPMTTRAYLLSKESSSDSIQQPDKYFKSGYFPRSYEIDFVKGDDFPHKVYLSDLEYHEASTPPERRNEPPTEILIDNKKIYNNVDYLNLVGVLETVDEHGPYRKKDDHVYALPFGIPPVLVDDAEGRFIVNGNQILINDDPELEAGETYTIKVRSVDSGGLSVVEEIQIEVEDLGGPSSPTPSKQQKKLLDGSDTWNIYRLSNPDKKVKLKNTDLPGIVSSMAGPTSFDLSKALLDDANLKGSIIENVNLRKAQLRNANLYGAYAFGVNLSKTDLRNADLRGADLSAANLRGADLRGADLRGAFLTAGADLTNANLEGANLNGANLFTANLTGANFTDATTKNASLRFTTVDDAVFDSVDLSTVNAFGVDFDTAASIEDTILPEESTYTDLQGALFAGADTWNELRREVFEGPLDLSGMDFPPIGFDLQGYDLTNVTLDDSYMEFVDLTGVDLRGSSLRGAKLFGATLSEANLEDADLTGAFLPGSIHVDTNYKDAILDKTVFSGAEVNGTDFTNTSFKDADIRFVNQAISREIAMGDFEPANFTGSDLTDSRFRASIFRDSIFTGVDFSDLGDVTATDFSMIVI
jgi:uncharacterized protein YjbI with pentapeptide repeats